MKKIRDCQIDPTAKISDFVNLYECTISSKCFIGPFVEIQKGVFIDKESKISSHSFLCEGVTIGKNCFIAHSVTFTNDLFDSEVPNDKEWVLRKTIVGDNVRIGSNATILPVKIGDNSIIGAGAVVTKDIPENFICYGNPAKLVKRK